MKAIAAPAAAPARKKPNFTIPRTMQPKGYCRLVIGVSKITSCESIECETY